MRWVFKQCVSHFRKVTLVSDHGVEGVDNACATQDEPVIEVYQSEELA